MGKKPKLSKVIQPTTELYKNKPDMVNELNGYYYIHLHQKNVGRMYEGQNLQNGFTDDEITDKFKSYKNENMTKVVTNQYLQGVQASIHQSGKYSNLIQNAFTDNKNGDQTMAILDSFQEAITNGFNEAFDTSRVVTLLYNEKNSSFKGNVTNLNALFANDSSEGNIQKGINFLDKILEGLASTVELIRDETYGSTLATMLRNLKNTSPGLVGTKILNALPPDNQLNGTTINESEVKAVVGYLRQIGAYLEKGNREILNADTLRGLIQNQFYAGIAEYFMLHLRKNAVTQIFKELDKVVMSQTGNDAIELDLVDPETGAYTGNYMQNSYFNESQNAKESGKADGVAKNISLSLDSVFSDGGKYGNLIMDLRISNKAYSTNHFGFKQNNLNTYNDIYGLGGGMLLGQGMDLLFTASNISNKYLAYNVLCRDLNNNNENHGGGFPNALQALQDVLLTRNIVYLAAGRGKQDFSQLLLLNGEIMSMWDIVKYVLFNDVGTSSSKLAKNNQEDPNGHGVYLSIPNREKLWSELSNPNKVTRTKVTNQKIANKAMHLHIIPKKILAYAGSVNLQQKAKLKNVQS